MSVRRRFALGAGLAVACAALAPAVTGLARDGEHADPVVPVAVATAPSGAVVDAADRARGNWLRGAIAAAADGATIDVAPGRYAGPFVVDRPVVLEGHGRAVLVGDRATHVVAVRAADVTIAGFEIRESGLDLTQDHAAVHVTGARATIRDNRIAESLHGIYVRQADDVRIEGNRIVGMAQAIAVVDPFARLTPEGGEVCETPLAQDRSGNGVHLWNSRRARIERNVIRDTRDGIYFSFVNDSNVRRNDVARVRYGLHYMYSDRNRFEANVFHDSAAGAALMYSSGLVLERNRFAANRSHRAYGLLMQSVDDTVVDDNEIAGNTLGLYIENGNANEVLDNRIAGNYVGIRVSETSNANVFAGNHFVGNVHPVETAGGNGTNEWARDGRGNAWSDAAQIDLDGDGVADLPHRELDLFGRIRRDLPAVGLLAGSPAERLLRLVHARVALPGAAGIVDPAPLVTGGSR